MRSIEELRGLVTAVTRVVVQERHHLRHLLLLQLAGPAPRAEARPPLVHGAGRRLLRVPGVPVPPPQHRVLYCTVLYCTVLYRCPSTSTSTPSLSTSPPCCSASEAPSSGLPRSATTVISAVTVTTPVLCSGNISDAQLRLCHHHEELGHILGHIEDLGLDREHGGLLLVPGPGDPAAAHLGAAGRGADRRVGAGHRAAAAPQEVFSRVLTLEMSHGCMYTGVFTILASLLRQF